MKTILAYGAIIGAIGLMIFMWSQVFGTDRPLSRLQTLLMSIAVVLIILDLVLPKSEKRKIGGLWGLLFPTYILILVGHLTIGIKTRYSTVLPPIWKSPWSEIVPMIQVYLLAFAVAACLHYLNHKKYPPIREKGSSKAEKAYKHRLRKRKS